MKNRVYRFDVTSEQTSLRLDQLLAGLAPGISRTQARQIIDLGGVHVDGRRIRRCSQQLSPGMHVEMFVDGQPLSPWQMSSADILAEDPYLLVIDKPAGVETQPTPARYKGTLYHALRLYLEQTRGKEKVELGMVQRLDRGTSGVMVFSVHRKAHRGLTEILRERRADKRYLALVSGIPQPDRGEFRSLLARSRAANLVKSVARGGKEAITRYRTLARLPGAALVEVELLTGRSHQIRAHFSEAGHPLLGDDRYGGPVDFAGLDLAFPLLHSWRLAFRHPVTGARVSHIAPPPGLWKEVWAAIDAPGGELDDLLMTAATESAWEGRNAELSAD